MELSQKVIIDPEELKHMIIWVFSEKYEVVQVNLEDYMVSNSSTLSLEMIKTVIKITYDSINLNTPKSGLTVNTTLNNKSPSEKTVSNGVIYPTSVGIMKRINWIVHNYGRIHNSTPKASSITTVKKLDIYTKIVQIVIRKVKV